MPSTEEAAAPAAPTTFPRSFTMQTARVGVEPAANSREFPNPVSPRSDKTSFSKRNPHSILPRYRHIPSKAMLLFLYSFFAPSGFFSYMLYYIDEHIICQFLGMLFLGSVMATFHGPRKIVYFLHGICYTDFVNTYRICRSGSPAVLASRRISQ